MPRMQLMTAKTKLNLSEFQKSFLVEVGPNNFLTSVNRFIHEWTTNEKKEVASNDSHASSFICIRFEAIRF